MSEFAKDDFVIFPPGMTEEQKATLKRNVAKADAERKANESRPCR